MSTPTPSRAEGRDEQLFAFYLAWKNGDRSPLTFRSSSRGSSTRRRAAKTSSTRLFFGIHEAITMPEKIKNQTLSIYKEVLSDVP